MEFKEEPKEAVRWVYEARKTKGFMILKNFSDSCMQMRLRNYEAQRTIKRDLGQEPQDLFYFSHILLTLDLT